MKRKLSIILIVLCFTFSFAVTSYAQNSNESKKDNTKYSASAEGVLNLDEMTVVSSSEAMTLQSLSPSATIYTNVQCIGSGLVDLSTEIVANMGINAVNGFHWYEKSNGTIRSDSINGFNQVGQYFYNRMSQFTETPGHVIILCGSEGTILFNWTFNIPWETVPIDLYATVR